jgi:hypothetical protein
VANAQRVYVRWTQQYVDSKSAGQNPDTSKGVEIDNVTRIDVCDGMLKLTRSKPAGAPKDLFGDVAGEVTAYIPVRDVSRVISIDGRTPQGLHDDLITSLD